MNMIVSISQRILIN